MLRLAFGAMAPAGARAKLSVLIFHRVLPEPDPMQPGEVDAVRFDQICTWIRRWFNVLPLGEAVHRLREGTLPARSLAITFDDGYADNHSVALPILLRHGLCATFFVSTAYLGRGLMWNDRVIEAVRASRRDTIEAADLGATDRLSLRDWEGKAAAAQALLKVIKHLPAEQRAVAVSEIEHRTDATATTGLMMTPDELRAMAAAGMEIGAHTHTHPILARLDAHGAEQEICLGKSRLEDVLDKPVTLFAYPNGKPVQDFSPAHMEMARRAGFDAAVTTAPGVAMRRTNAFALPRFTPWDHQKFRFGLRLLKNLRNVQA